MNTPDLRAWLFDGADAPDASDPVVAGLIRDFTAIDTAARGLDPLAPPALSIDALVADPVADELRRDLDAIDAAAAALGDGIGRGGGNGVAGAPTSTTAVGRRVASRLVAEIGSAEASGLGVAAATARPVLLPGVPEDVSRAALAAVFADEVAAGLGRDRRAIDLAAVALPRLAPPADLVAAVEAAVRADPRPVVAWEAPAPANRAPASTRWRRGAWGAFGLLAAAAAALLVFLGPGGPPPSAPGAPPEGDPADWTVRGNAGPRPTVDLRLSVKHGDAPIARLRRGEPYPAGDVLLFRVDLDRDASVALLRVDRDAVTSLWAADASSGPTDVRQGAEALGWALEAGESAAVYVAVAGRGVSAEQLQEALPPGDDPGGVCAAVEALGYGCAAVRVEEVR